MRVKSFKIKLLVCFKGADAEVGFGLCHKDDAIEATNAVPSVRLMHQVGAAGNGQAVHQAVHKARARRHTRIDRIDFKNKRIRTVTDPNQDSLKIYSMFATAIGVPLTN